MNVFKNIQIRLSNFIYVMYSNETIQITEEA